MQLDEMIQWLIGVGAAMGADCESCIRTCMAMARECGADEQQIDIAASIGSRVRQCAGKMAHSTGEASRAAEKESTTCCGHVGIKDLKGRQE